LLLIYLLVVELDHWNGDRRWFTATCTISTYNH